MDTAREGVEGMKQKNSFDTDTLGCVKQIAIGKLLHNTGSSAGCSVMGAGWDGG